MNQSDEHNSAVSQDPEQHDKLEHWRLEQEALLEQVTFPAEDDESCLEFVSNVKYVGGLDISYVKGTEEACVSLVVCNLSDLSVVYSDFERITMDEPYIPGFLAFREAKFLRRLIEKYESRQKLNPNKIPLAQVYLTDGNGILHPKRCGIATHLGVLIQRPTVGIAKKFLRVEGLEKDQALDMFREKINEDPQGGFTAAYLTDSHDAVLGAAVRSAAGLTKPIFVSQGNALSLAASLKIVERCAKYRVPEPIRQADLLSRSWLRDGPEFVQRSLEKQLV